MRRIRQFAINSALVLASLALGLLFCELVLFRFVLLPSDVPANAFTNGLVRYAPNQSGVWRIRNDVAAPFRINAQGWNTGAGDYVRERKAGVGRVAVVGDSMIEAMQVAHDRSMAERLAADLSTEGRPTEVYRFAVSGAPLTQYLLMIEREVLAYQPDAVVVLLCHNDFDEMFRFVQGRYTSSFLKLRMAGGQVAEEIPPVPWKPTLADWLRRTATARYLYYRWQVRVDTLRNVLLGIAPAQAQRYEANVDIAAVERVWPDVVAATDHVFGRLEALARRSGTRLVIVIDGVRQAIYDGDTSQALALNRLAGELAGKHGFAFVDLHPAFQADWRANRQGFELPSDSHWNEHGHMVAARAVAAALREAR